MMQRIACIYNDSSGSATEEQLISEQFNKLDVAVDFLDIKSGETKLAKRLESKTYTSIVAAGGDGTVRLSAQLAVRCNLVLGILPLGTLNHFAKDMNLPLDLEGAAKVIANNNTSKIDYCRVNGQVFVNNASLGMYPATVIGREKSQKLLGKWLAASLSFLRVLRTNKSLKCTAVLPEGSSDYNSPLIFIGNNRYSVDRAGLCSRDKLNGGQMFIYVVRTTSRLRLILLALLQLLGISLQQIDLLKQSQGPVTLQSLESKTYVALDGEVMKMKFPMKFEMKAGQITVLSA